MLDKQDYVNLEERMATRYISNWETWKELCEQNDIDPYKTVEFGIDDGGGNSTDFEYIGDTPERDKEKDHDEEWKNARDAYSGEREEK